MHESQPRWARKIITPAAKAIKAARLLKGLSRMDAGKLCGWTPKAFEQIENGRTYLSRDRTLRIATSLGYKSDEFLQIETNPDLYLARAKDHSVGILRQPTKPRRNVYKRITKEVRIIRILRKRAKLSQYDAAARCGYANSIFGQIENGRIELPQERVRHIVESLGYSQAEYQRLLGAEVLRDEIVDQCRAYLEQLEDHKLESAQTVIKALLK